MKAYTYYFPDSDGSLPSFDIASCEDDVDATLRCAEMLRQRPGRSLIEVFEDDRLVARFDDAPMSGEEREADPVAKAPRAANGNARDTEQ